MKAHREMTWRQETMVGLLFFLLVFIFPLFIFIFGNTGYQWITVFVGTSIFILMWLLHRENVKQDKVRGICKGRNRTGSVYLSGGLLCFIGIYLIVTRWDSLSVSDPFHWMWVLLALFFILRGVICIRAGSEYNKTIDRLEEYEAQLKRLRFELDERGRLKRLTPTDAN